LETESRAALSFIAKKPRLQSNTLQGKAQPSVRHANEARIYGVIGIWGWG
jgi:hypothetical protein